MNMQVSAKRVMAGFALSCLVAQLPAARAFDVATVHPGCQQERAWCERAAAVSYGDPARFRNALSAVIAVDWMKTVREAQRQATENGHTVAAPTAEEIASELIQSWRAGGACCEVKLKPPIDEQRAASAVGEFDRICSRSRDGSKSGDELANECREAVGATKAPQR
jgi:hypothetical protein